MARKLRMSVPQHFAYNALAARRCYQVGSAVCEVLFYGNDFVPKVGFTTNYIKVLLGEKQCCFRDLNGTGAQNFDRVRRAIEGYNLQIRHLRDSVTCGDALFTAICESLMEHGFLRLPDVTDIKTYAADQKSEGI